MAPEETLIKTHFPYAGSIDGQEVESAYPICVYNGLRVVALLEDSGLAFYLYKMITKVGEKAGVYVWNIGDFVRVIETQKPTQNGS